MSKTKNIENYEFELQAVFNNDKTRAMLEVYAKKEFNQGTNIF